MKRRLIIGKRYPERAAAGEPLLERPRTRRTLHRGSATAVVLECAKKVRSSISISELALRTKLSPTAVSTAVGELIQRGALERTNAIAPFLYRAVKG